MSTTGVSLLCADTQSLIFLLIKRPQTCGRRTAATTTTTTATTAGTIQNPERPTVTGLWVDQEQTRTDKPRDGRRGRGHCLWSQACRAGGRGGCGGGMEGEQRGGVASERPTEW